MSQLLWWSLKLIETDWLGFLMIMIMVTSDSRGRSRQFLKGKVARGHIARLSEKHKENKNIAVWVKNIKNKTEKQSKDALVPIWINTKHMYNNWSATILLKLPNNQPRPWLIPIYLNLSLITSIYPNLPQFTPIYLDLHQITLHYLDLP